MFFDKKMILNKLNNQSIVVGYDLGDEVSQISVAHLNGEEPITLSTVAGAEQFNIPTVLCKRREVNQWFYGKEAIRNAKEEDGILVDHLLKKALLLEEVELEGMNVNPIELLALFIKKSFSMLGMVSSLANVVAIMITVDSLNAEIVELLQKTIEGMNMKKDMILFQSHEESAFYYVMNQNQELHDYQVGICDFVQGHLKTYCIEMDKKTNPILTRVQQTDYEEITQQSDEDLLRAAKELCKERIISSVFLIGEKFQGDWYKKSISYLCSGRRVFQGNNLFSKGACYAMLEKLHPAELSRDYVFLGRDKLKYNIGIILQNGEEENYECLLEAGQNWFEANDRIDFFIDSGNTITILITPLCEKTEKKIEFPLSGIPIRPRKTTRIHMEVKMNAENQLQIYCKDMGFGDIFKSSGMEWTDSFII